MTCCFWLMVHSNTHLWFLSKTVPFAANHQFLYDWTVMPVLLLLYPVGTLTPKSQWIFNSVLLFTFQEDLVVPETMHGSSVPSLSVYRYLISYEFVVTFRIMHGCTKGHDLASFLIFWVLPCVLHILAYFHVLHWQLKCAGTRGYPK